MAVWGLLATSPIGTDVLRLYYETVLPARWNQCRGRWEAWRPLDDILALPRVSRPCVGTHCCVRHTRCTDRLLPQAEPLFHNKPSTSVFLNVDCVWIWNKACSKNVVWSLGNGFDTQREFKAHKCWQSAACLKSWRFLEVERYKEPLHRV